MSTVPRFRFTAPVGAGHQPIIAPIRGGTAQLRPLAHGETSPQRAVFEAMSVQSRYDRFLSGTSALTPGMWRALAAVDGCHHVAWLASVDGVPAGVARYITTGPRTAEIAFEVVDRHHGRGLGTVLLDTVTTVAAAFRIRRLQATVLDSNHASRHLLSLVGLSLQPSGGLLEADGPFRLLDRPRLERPAVVSVSYAARRGAMSDRSARGLVA